MIACREVHEIAELERIVDLEILVWEMNPRDAVPVNTLKTLMHNGGSVIGAYEGDTLVGFTVALPARRGQDWLLWSHMAGVHPSHRGHGIGFMLKQAQRLWALENGYARIGWTYDPMQSANANFNLRRLGATAVAYLVNHYGEMSDGINQGLPSDRLEIAWWLNDARAVAAAENRLDFTPVREEEVTGWVTMGTDGLPAVHPLKEAPMIRIELPLNSSALRRDALRGRTWQEALRHAFLAAFDAGYIAVDFHRDSERGCYLLQRR